MTGGGFYVVSFVSCSSCFMLKFSGRYVIKLLGVWRAQASSFQVQCLLWGKCLCDQSLSMPTFLINGSLCFHLIFVFYFEAQIPALWGGKWSFRMAVAPLWILSSGQQFSPLAEQLVWKWPNPLIAVGLRWLEPADKGACCSMEIKLLQCSPFLLSSQRHLPWLFSNHFCHKIRHSSRLEILVQLAVCKCLQTWP